MSNEQRYTEHIEAGYDDRGEFSVDCPNCEKTHTIFTQHDRDPEYYTVVKIRCDCHHLVVFDLPVN